MNKKKLAKLRRESDKLRAGKNNIKSSQLIRFAGKLGRQRDTSRGKEPTYVNVYFPELNPLSIPAPNIKPYTAVNVLDILEQDFAKWEAVAEAEKVEETKAHENDNAISAITVRTDRDPSGT